MVEEKMKTIGVKLYVKADKTVDIIARKKGISKSEMYRVIITEYFKNNPLTDAEKEIVDSMM